MNDEVMTILAKWLASEGGDLAPGEYKVEDRIVRLSVSGMITVGDPVSYTPTVKISLLTVMAVLLHRMGFQRDAAGDLLVASITEAMAVGESPTGAIGEIVDDLNSAMERVRSITAALPKATRRGPTRIKEMRVEILGEDDRLAS